MLVNKKRVDLQAKSMIFGEVGETIWERRDWQGEVYEARSTRRGLRSL